MRLRELIEGVDASPLTGDLGQEVPSLHYDSRQVKPGSLFVAIRGFRWDGHDFIPQALQAGASALVVESEPDFSSLPAGVTVLRVPDSRLALARMAANFYHHPSHQVRLIGVTGTNGKTTITYLIESILSQAGHRVGVIGTINYHFAGQVLPAERTTPESLDLQRTLGEMVAGGADYVVMEVSSHSLELARVAGCEFDLAIFTNLTPDHLDFHRDLDRYLGAKLRLFSELGRSRAKETRKLALINMDDPSAPEVAQATSVETWGYGRKNNSRLMATDLELSLAGTRLRARTPRGELSLQSRLIGEHNAYNILAAVGAGIWGEVPSSQIVEGIARVDRIPGRWERVDSGRGFTVVVDYAHTGDALERTLRAARGLCRGRVITVFGCGGDRDRTKRPVMGEVAAKYSDYFIITSDNPRSEDPLAIISEIEAGVKKAYPGRDNYVKMEDRKEAIAEAIGMAKDEDLIIIAGKGHESYQILREGIIPFDDREVARSLLSKKLRRER